MTRTLEDIELLCKQYADSRDVMVERVNNLNDQIDALKRKYLYGIKNAMRDVAAKKSILYTAIDQNRHLFGTPRSRIFHGIKAGLQKIKAAVKFEKSNEGNIVNLIHKHLKEHLDILVKTNEKIIKSGLDDLTDADLKKIGLKRHPSFDSILIKSTDSEIDKMVDALLSDYESEELTEKEF